MGISVVDCLLFDVYTGKSIHSHKIKKESLNNLTLSLDSNKLYKNNFCPECLDIQRYCGVDFMECIDTQFRRIVFKIFLCENVVLLFSHNSIIFIF